MSKICPICKQLHEDEDVICGYGCGVRLVPMPEDPNPALNLGDANAISGGVSINQSKNITSHDTHYHSTTVHERSKSESELKLDANNQLRAKAEEIMAERGRIDSIAMGQLRPLALRLGVDEETFKSIIKDVRSNRNGSASGLSAANARYLQQAQQAVQTNDKDALSNLTPRLEAMAAISQDDNVQYLYYLTLSLFYPLKSMEVYERQTDENYWRTFWAIISYIRTGKNAEATSTLALFDPLRYEKSEEDQNLLEAYFNIMKQDKDGAQEFLDEILGEPTEQVKPLLRAVESTLYEEDAESMEVRFYMERVMTKSDVVVKTQKNAEPTAPIEEPAKKALKPEVINKDNKEATELYSKASAASGAKRVMLLQKAADAGSLEAMFDLADCYADGEGVKKDTPLAIKWLTKAADAGYVKAQLGLAGAYFTGEEGLDQNYSLVEKYLLMAAEKENTEAQGLLSQIYVGMEDYDKALVWARKASQMEDARACSVLGQLFDEGLGVDMDHAEAFKWFKKAAELGDADAMDALGNCYLNGEGVTKDLTEAAKWYKKSAELGNVGGMGDLGVCYLNGEGVTKDLTEAEKWLQKAADGGMEDAKELLDQIRNSGFPLQDENDLDEESEMNMAVEAYNNEDYETALSIWNRLAERFNAEAMCEIGLCCCQGLGVAEDYVEGAKWYKKAAELGDARGMALLGVCYSNGYGVKKNQKEAVKWYKKGATLGNVQAMVDLATLLSESGKAEEAVEWGQKALDSGYEDENGEIAKIINSASAPIPQVVFDNAWVTQENDQCIGIHYSLRVIGQKGKMMTFKFKTTSSKSNSKDSTGTICDGYLKDKADLDDTQWSNVWFAMSVAESVANLQYYPGIDLESELSVYGSNNQCLGRYFIKYVVNHEVHIIRRDKLIFVKVKTQGNRGNTNES